jgi:hypothetical protein
MFQKEVIVDCRGHLYGRLASIVAKELLSGQKIVRVLVASLSFVVLAHLGLAQTLVRTEEIVRSGSCTCQQRTGGREERERRERKKDDDEKEKKKLFFPFAFNVRCRLALTIFFLLLGSFAGSRSLATVYRNKRKCKPTHTREKKKKKKAKNYFFFLFFAYFFFFFFIFVLFVGQCAFCASCASAATRTTRAARSICARRPR